VEASTAQPRREAGKALRRRRIIEAAGALAREVGLQDVERSLRLGSRQRERLQQVAARGLRQDVDADQQDDPRDDDAPPPAVAPCGQSGEHARRLRPRGEPAAPYGPWIRVSRRRAPPRPPCAPRPCRGRAPARSGLRARPSGAPPAANTRRPARGRSSASGST